MGRTHRPIISGATYFVTTTAYDRQRWFAQAELAQIVVDQWKHYECDYGFHLDTYCVMPDHYHVVLCVGERKTISEILHVVDSYVATLVNQYLGKWERKVKVWQGRPWDEVIRSEEMYWQKIAYVLLNPWRARLVREPLDLYPFSDIKEWIEREGEEAMLELFSRYRRQSE
ncbi:MAG TPA: transposase [Anaerolineae bacterium]|nr:transposase [Anaerolineae bacterium]